MRQTRVELKFILIWAPKYRRLTTVFIAKLFELSVNLIKQFHHAKTYLKMFSIKTKFK